MNSKISVVIPCYNCSQTIDQCVLSVTQQTKSVYEIILINDGSTDNTLDHLYMIKKKYEEKGILITVIDQKNQGPSASRNKGLENAKGDWVAFLDSDDFWYEDKLEIQMDIINKNPGVDLVGGNKKLRVKFFKPDNYDIIHIDFNRLCFKNYFLISSTIISKKIAKKYRFNLKQKYSEDYRFFLEILSEGNIGVYANIPLSSSIENKRDYGESGLSSNIYKMEKGELSNFKFLLSRGKLSSLKYLIIIVFSLLKFIRRLIIVTLNYKTSQSPSKKTVDNTK